MKEPTQEQIKEFWEWCGIEEVKSGFRGDPLGVSTITVPKALPPIDLNNLFKYAVPIAVKILKGVNGNTLFGWMRLFGLWRMKLQDTPDPALALFWALWQVKETK